MRQNPIPLLLLFLAIALVPTLMSAQETKKKAGAVIDRNDSAPDLERVRKMIAWGPHRKSPLAAGRQLVLNRNSRYRKQRHERRGRYRLRMRNRKASFTAINYRPPK